MLDRRITLRFRMPGMFVNHQFVPSTQYREEQVWAQQSDGGSTEEVRPEGTRVTRVVNWLIRYRQDLVVFPISRLFIRDENGLLYSVEGLAETENQRRRFITISGVARVPDLPASPGNGEDG